MSAPLSPAIAAVAAVMDEIDQCRNPVPCELCRQRMQSILDMGAVAERERIAAHLENLAANYPEDVFPAGSDSRDAVSGTAMRHACRNAARSVREDLSEEDGDG